MPLLSGIDLVNTNYRKIAFGIRIKIAYNFYRTSIWGNRATGSKKSVRFISGFFPPVCPNDLADGIGRSMAS
jgi:hypothetical protein